MPKTFRILFLGAGFSKPAGLPLGSELFREVRKLLRTKHGLDNFVEKDLDRYIRYVEACKGRKLTADSVDYERFLGFLDVEHHLGLKGKDTWSDEGNESQLLVKHAIAQVLHERTPHKPPDLYRSFTRRLNASDYVLTFNYDTLLEYALEAEGVPYRLFPTRYLDTSPPFDEVDNSHEEIILLKLHGSIDWCDRAVYEKKAAAIRADPYYPHELGYSSEAKHPVFGSSPVAESEPITDGPRNEDDPLAKIYRIGDLEPLFRCSFWEWCPLILAPSQTKIFYVQPLRNLWWGLQRNAGQFNLSLGVVGYSLPTYDEYARQFLFHAFSNYTGVDLAWEFENPALKRAPIRILDYRPQGDSGADIRTRYRFADWSQTELRLDGLNKSTVKWLLDRAPTYPPSA